MYVLTDGEGCWRHQCGRRGPDWLWAHGQPLLGLPDAGACPDTRQFSESEDLKNPRVLRPPLRPHINSNNTNMPYHDTLLTRWLHQFPACMHLERYLQFLTRAVVRCLQGVMPDIVTMAKGIGNGLPLAAVVTTPEIAQVCQLNIPWEDPAEKPSPPCPLLHAI